MYPTRRLLENSRKICITRGVLRIIESRYCSQTYLQPFSWNYFKANMTRRKKYLKWNTLLLLLVFWCLYDNSKAFTYVCEATSNTNCVPREQLHKWMIWDKEEACLCYLFIRFSVMLASSFPKLQGSLYPEKNLFMFSWQPTVLRLSR